VLDPIPIDHAQGVTVKITLVLGVALSLSTLAAGAQTAPARVYGSFWELGAMRAHFDLKVGPDEAQRLPMSGGRSIEVARAGTAGPTVRFLDAKGHELQAAKFGNGTADKSVTVAVCGANVVISSHESANDPCSTQ
jgi:hypothetical protein